MGKTTSRLHRIHSIRGQPIDVSEGTYIGYVLPMGDLVKDLTKDLNSKILNL